MKKYLCLILAAACLLCALAVPVSAEPMIPAVNTYVPGQFSDVALGAWFTPYVATAYTLGLMQGNPDGTFSPGGDVTLAETVTLASRLHRLSRGDTGAFPETQPWYQAYVDYAGENGLLTVAYPDYDVPATRSQFAAIMAKTLPQGGLEAIRELEDGAIPDVPMDGENAAEIYALYRAGILIGNDDQGTFAPETQIRRSEVAAIAVRLADPEQRLTGPVDDGRPNLTLQPEMGDEFFADAAMLGNSLVDGMMLFSGLKMDYYGGTSKTVYNNRLEEMLRKQYGKIYIQLGINEVGGSKENYIEAYRKIILRIQETMPGAEIYIMAITPVTRNKDAAGLFTMKRLGEFNEALYALAEETGCWYLDTFTLMCDDSGFLPASYGGWDGSPHLSTSGYQAWAALIRTYYNP